MADPRQPLDLSFLRSRVVLKRIAIATLTFAIGGLAYGLLAPKWYRSVLTVVPTKPPKGGVSGILGMDLDALASGLDAAIGAADAPRIAAVLQSIAVSDAVIERFRLRERYDENYQETTRDELWEHCDVKVLTKPNLVQLSCEDKDPRFVQEMLAYFAEYGNQVFRRVSGSSASEEVHFLEGRVTELRQQADEVAARMRQFQEEHKIVDLDAQAKAVVSAMAALNGQRIAKQLELEWARKFSSADEATTQQLRSQLSVVGDRLRDLEERPEAVPVLSDTADRSVKGRKADVFPPAMSVPELRAQFEKLYRDRRVAEETLVFALERLEAAKANEAREVSTFLVLDPPALPTKKSRPKRALIFLSAALLGMTAAVLFELLQQNGSIPRVWPRRDAPVEQGGPRLVEEASTSQRTGAHRGGTLD
jgi:tyrosine-protein kinase Etk/Wzc